MKSCICNSSEEWTPLDFICGLLNNSSKFSSCTFSQGSQYYMRMGVAYRCREHLPPILICCNSIMNTWEPQFCRKHFQMQFLKRKKKFFGSGNAFVPNRQQAIATCKPLPEPVMNQFIDESLGFSESYSSSYCVIFTFERHFQYKLMY